MFRGILKKFFNNGTECATIALQECYSNASGELRDLYGTAT